MQNHPPNYGRTGKRSSFSNASNVPITLKCTKKLVKRLLKSGFLRVKACLSPCCSSHALCCCSPMSNSNTDMCAFHYSHLPVSLQIMANYHTAANVSLAGRCGGIADFAMLSCSCSWPSKKASFNSLNTPPLLKRTHWESNRQPAKTPNKSYNWRLDLPATLTAALPT